MINLKKKKFNLPLILYVLDRIKKNILSLLDNGILQIHFKPGAEILLSDAVLIVEAMEKVGKGISCINDAGEFVSVDQKVRLFSASEDSNIFTIADAIAYYSFGQKLIANFYIKNNKPKVPTRAFTIKKQATAWLKTFILNKFNYYLSNAIRPNMLMFQTTLKKTE